MKREEAIQKFRDMWEWMANKTEEYKRKVSKFEYFWENNFDDLEIPMHFCFLCEYAEEQFFNKGGNDECECCPIDFEMGKCTGYNEEGVRYIHTEWYACPKTDWQEAARLCREIARLPEKEET